MRIGVDLDNTLICYDSAFHKAAVEKKLIQESFAKEKDRIRNHLRSQGLEGEWTALQGYVYGDRMMWAEAFPQAVETLKYLKESGHEISIISHKTLHPFTGSAANLHTAAYDWLEAAGILSIVPFRNIFFELSKEEKVSRIGSRHCEAFVDDLPEILLSPNFPEEAKRILFSPHGSHIDFEGVTVAAHWATISALVGAKLTHATS